MRHHTIDLRKKPSPWKDIIGGILIFTLGAALFIVVPSALRPLTCSLQHQVLVCE